MDKKRYGFVAVLLHLLAPGLGFLYAGRVYLSFFFPVLLIAFILFMGWSRLILQPWGVWAIWTAIIAVYALLIPWVFFSARKGKAWLPDRIKRWGMYLFFVLALVLTVAVMMLYRSQLLGYETFRLPSLSMANTLLPNDYIIVDTWAYVDKEPQRGDILVFRYPLDPKTWFIKRLVAGSGETVAIHDGRLIVNDNKVEEPYVLEANNIKTSSKDYAVKQLQQGYLFVMGDNRDFSNDSRVWGGLERQKVYGEATAIWLSFAGGRGLRFERIRSLKKQRAPNSAQ